MKYWICLIIVLSSLLSSSTFCADLDTVRKVLEKSLVSPSAQCAKPGKVCKYYENFLREGVPSKPLQQALHFYSRNFPSYANQRYITIADYSQKSDKKRFYLLDMELGTVKRYTVSHGGGYRIVNKVEYDYGDPDHKGFLKRCQYKNSRLNMTRPGFFLTAERYFSNGDKNNHHEVRDKAGLLIRGWNNISKGPTTNALKLDGLTPKVNDHARTAGVVMHGAWYNETRRTNQSIMGRSYGCPAFQPDDAPEVLNTIAGGSLYYSFVPQCSDDMKEVEKQVVGWESICLD